MLPAKCILPILDHNNKSGLSVLGGFSDHGTVQLPANKKKECGSSYYDKWSLNYQN